MTDRVNQELDHLFRREAGKMVAILARSFGPSHLDLAETVVQEALLKAAQTWPFNGVPDNPAAWIMQVAKRKAIDMMRKDKKLSFDNDDIDSMADETEESDEEIADDQLRLMFLCCHPVLPHEARVALTLKTICGFGVAEIARAFLAKDEAIAQRLVRAKRKIKDDGLTLEWPEPADLAKRLDAVLDTIYLVFNEGYAAHAGDKLVREDMCKEACRLALLVSEHPLGRVPKVQALLALLFLQRSRLKTRVDSEGEVLLLADQDRSQWDHEMITQGLHHLNEAAAGEELSNFHLLAGIAACHGTAESFAATDWKTILMYYDALLAMHPSPVIALNRAVALSYVEGLKVALKALVAMQSDLLKGYYLYPATRADFLRRMGETKKAQAFYKEALELVKTDPERRFLQKRLDECRDAPVGI